MNDVDELSLTVARLEAHLNHYLAKNEKITQLIRLLKINFVLAKYGLDQLIVELHVIRTTTIYSLS